MKLPNLLEYLAEVFDGIIIVFFVIIAISKNPENIMNTGLILIFISYLTKLIGRIISLFSRRKE